MAFSDKIFFLIAAIACLLVNSIDISVNPSLTGVNELTDYLPHKTYLFPGLYSGISEQKTSFLIAALYCMIHNMTLVLPQWIFDYHEIEHATLKPFEYLYAIDVHSARSLEDLRNFRFVTELPEHLYSPCLSQLHAASAQYMYLPNSTILADYREMLGVICVHGDGTFYSVGAAVQESLGLLFFLDFQWHPAVQSLRSTLVLNELYYRIVDIILLRMQQTMGHSDFISVHTTVEEDFRKACKGWTKRPFNEPNEAHYYRACYESDTVIYNLLTRSVAFPVNNSVLMIMNRNRRDSTFEELPNLCHRDCSNTTGNCFVFQCIRKESIISDAELFEQFPDLVQSPSSVAMIDSVLATHGILFLGNVYSTLSVEIVQDRLLGRTPYTESLYYNRLCHQHSSNLDECV